MMNNPKNSEIEQTTIFFFKDGQFDMPGILPIMVDQIIMVNIEGKDKDIAGRYIVDSVEDSYMGYRQNPYYTRHVYLKTHLAEDYKD